MGLIVCPSRELARQTHEVVLGYIQSLKQGGFPELRALLAMGGIDMREQVYAHSAEPLLYEEDDHTPLLLVSACVPSYKQWLWMMEWLCSAATTMHVLLDAIHMTSAICHACGFADIQ